MTVNLELSPDVNAPEDNGRPVMTDRLPQNV
jgi:hypothetical protein